MKSATSRSQDRVAYIIPKSH